LRAIGDAPPGLAQISHITQRLRAGLINVARFAGLRTRGERIELFPQEENGSLERRQLAVEQGAELLGWATQSDIELTEQGVDGADVVEAHFVD
jgi:hypothetical protein